MESELLELTGMDEAAIRAGFIEKDGSASHRDGMLLYSFAKALSPNRILEVGYNEYATMMLTAGAMTGNFDTKLVSVGKKIVNNRFISIINPFPSKHSLVIGEPEKLLSKVLSLLQGCPDFIFFNTNEYWNLYYDIALKDATIVSLEIPPIRFLKFSNLYIGKKYDSNKDPGTD